MKKYLAVFVAMIGIIASTSASAPCVWLYFDEPTIEE